MMSAWLKARLEYLALGFVQDTVSELEKKVHLQGMKSFPLPTVAETDGQPSAENLICWPTVGLLLVICQ